MMNCSHDNQSKLFDNTSVGGVFVNGITTGSGEEEEEDHGKTCARVLIPLFFIPVFIIGLVGNSFVIITVVTNKQMRSTTNILIFNLALADLLFILICVPLTGFSYLSPDWPLGLHVCRLYQYLIHVTAHASVDTLVLMSFDRYLAVVHPIRSMTLRNTRNALIVVLLMWLTICLLHSPIYPHFSVLLIDGNHMCLNPNFIQAPNLYSKTFYGTFFLFGLLIPLLIIIIFYALIISRLLKLASQMKTRNMLREKKIINEGGKLETKTTSESSHSKKRVTKMIVVVVTVFALCWIPVHIMFLLQFFSHVEVTKNFICFRIFCNCLSYANSCINPILYAFLSDNFRNSFKRLMFACCLSHWRNKQLGNRRNKRTCCDKTTIANMTVAMEMKPMTKEKIDVRKIEEKEEE